MLTARQVFDLASAIDPRYQALLLLAVFGSLRSGELAALRRADVDLSAQTVRISRQLVDCTAAASAPRLPAIASSASARDADDRVWEVIRATARSSCIDTNHDHQAVAVAARRSLRRLPAPGGIRDCLEFFALRAWG